MLLGCGCGGWLELTLLAMATGSLGAAWAWVQGLFTKRHGPRE